MFGMKNAPEMQGIWLIIYYLIATVIKSSTVLILHVRGKKPKKTIQLSSRSNLELHLDKNSSHSGKEKLHAAGLSKDKFHNVFYQNYR